MNKKLEEIKNKYCFTVQQYTGVYADANLTKMFQEIDELFINDKKV
jgi:hypothetical protein